jgi:nucleoside-diphosphate kinase
MDQEREGVQGRFVVFGCFLMERTLVLIKPDGVERGLAGEILSRFEARGIRIIGLKMLVMTKEVAREHYAHLVTKPFYPDLESFMCGRPIIAAALEGKECVQVVRDMMGPTNSRKAMPGTIRGDFSMSTSRNIIHGSDSPETAEKEVARFFKAGELHSWKPLHAANFYAPDE